MIHQLFGESKIVEYTITENETAPGKVEVTNQPKLHRQCLTIMLITNRGINNQSICFRY